MRYEILIPVTSQVGDFAALLEQVPNEMTVVVNNLDNPGVEFYCIEAEKKGAQVFRHPENLGCAAAWNIGLRRVQPGELDYLIILSPSCRWDNDVFDFVQSIEAQERIKPQDFYLCRGQHFSDTHAFAITRSCVDKVGLFDENFHPVYYEDTDYQRRQFLVGSSRFSIEGLRTSAELNGGVRDPRVLDQYWKSAERLKAYYIEKWGGDHGSELFMTPFDDPTLTIRDWTLRAGSLAELQA